MNLHTRATYAYWVAAVSFAMLFVAAESSDSSGILGAKLMQTYHDEVYHRLYQAGEGHRLITFPYCPDASEPQFPQVSTSTPSGSRDLRNFSDEEYVVSLLKQRKAALDVYADLKVFQLVAVDEKRQSVTLNLQRIVCWKDCRLAWSYSELPVSAVVIPVQTFKERFFIPQVIIREELIPTEELEDFFQVDYEGTVCHRKEYTPTVSCEIDVKLYPFDLQKCSVAFLACMPRPFLALHSLEDYTGSTRLFVFDYASHDAYFTPCDSWDVSVSHPKVYNTCALAHNISERCCYDAVAHEILLRRQPVYQLVNLMLPAMLILIISSCVFLLPPKSSDKMSLCVAILLSMFVFNQIMYQKMPETGSTLPLLSQYFLVCVAVVSSSCILSSLVTIFEASEKPTRYAVCLDRFFFFVHMACSLIMTGLYFAYGYLPWSRHNFE